MWGKALKIFFFLQFSLMTSSHAALPPIENSVSPQRFRISVYEGQRQSKNPCYAKIETYGKSDMKDWYFSVGDLHVKLGFEPEYSEIKKSSVKLNGTFQSFQLGSIYQIPNMVASSNIVPTYTTSSELLLEDNLSPKAFTLLVKNKNFMREFPDKNFVCHDLKLAKYWPCYQPAKDFENRGGWCMRTDLEDDINF